MNILTEATGSLTSYYLIKAIQEAGYKAVGSDIDDFNHGKVLCDDFILMPSVIEENLWEKTFSLLHQHNINVVIPSLDETLLEWSKKQQKLQKKGIVVIVSPPETIQIFEDKWLTYKFFQSIGIATPKTSLQADFEIVKPRFGRGSSGIFTNSFQNDFSMDAMISQEKIFGVEYTVDCLFDNTGKPIYIIPRKRLALKDGKSTKGVVVLHKGIEKLVNKIAHHISFYGPINFQLFETETKELVMLEINPRIAGGMALGFAASENWIPLIIKNFLNNEKIAPKEVKNGLKMVRYYAECFI
jgi:carbamoyl-phosphate synthase large subunit